MSPVLWLLQAPTRQPSCVCQERCWHCHWGVGKWKCRWLRMCIIGAVIQQCAILSATEWTHPYTNKPHSNLSISLAEDDRKFLLSALNLNLPWCNKDWNHLQCSMISPCTTSPYATFNLIVSLVCVKIYQLMLRHPPCDINKEKLITVKL